MPSQCPTAAQLTALLKDDLSQSERTLIDAHLEECIACREKLNLAAGRVGTGHSTLLTGGDEPWSNVASAPDDPELEALLARLKPEKEGERIGPYKLLQEIGEGGFGTVWMAEQMEPVKRRVALKIIKLGMDTKEVIARFEQERQALAMMDHPHIAKVFDAGATQWGRPFFVMELVRGVPITDYCDQHQLPVRERLALFIQVCHALQHAHQKGIIHRDLKPSNILVTPGDGDAPVPKIIDFGVAKAMDRTLTDKTLFTQFEQMIGTPTYMSPEQAGVGPMDIDTRSDIYSLGVLLYELLSGRTPFDPDELKRAGYDEIRRLIRERDPPRPSTRLHTLKEIDLTAVATRRHVDAAKLTSMVRGDLDWIVMKALEKNRNRRYETANGLALDIQRYLVDEPVLARPPSFHYNAGKFIRKYKGPVAAATAIFLALIAGLIVSTVLYRREAAALSREAHQRHLAQQATARVEMERAKAESLNKEASRSHSSVADEQLRSAHAGAAFAHLARACEYDPGSILAAEKAIAALNDWSHPLPIAILAGHEGGISQAQFSPDGARIVTASDDKSARVWEASSGKVIATLSGHENYVHSAQFSPDGARIVTTSMDRTARVWEASSGRGIATLSGHEDYVGRAQFSPDGARIVTASLDKSVRVWEASSGQAIATLSGHAGVVMSAQFSPDGTRIVTASLDKTARVWEASSGQAIVTLSDHEREVEGAQFSPDGTRIVTASWDGTARVWEASSGKVIATLSGHENWVRSAQFSPDGARIVTASSDGTARVWEASTGRCIATLSGHEGKVESAQFSPDGARIVTASDDKSARVWEASSGQAIATLSGHEREVESARFSPDGARIVTASSDGTARVWEASSRPVIAMLSGHADKVQSAQFSSDGSRVVTASSDWTARVWEASSGRAIATLSGHGDAVMSAQFSPDGTRILTASYDKTARVWEASSGKVISTLSGHALGVRCAQFSPDGARIVTASLDKTARVWEASSGRAIATLSGHAGAVWSAQFSPDGTRIVTASNDETARVWEVSSGQAIATLSGHKLWVVSAQFSPDGTRIVTASWDGTARVWETQSGKAIATLSGHAGTLWSAQFSPDGTRIVTASNDKTARVWEAQSGKLQVTLIGHGDELTSARFSPDSARIVTASRDKTARIWQILPHDAGPPPEWFPDFLRYMAQMRLNPDGELETLKPEAWRALRERMRAVRRAAAGQETPYLKVLRRFVSE